MGYIFFKNGDLVSHFSKQQLTVTCLSTETEYTTLCQITKRTIWLHLFELELEREKNFIILKTNNKSSITFAFNI